MASINPCHARQYRWVTPEILAVFAEITNIYKTITPNLITEV